MPVPITLPPLPVWESDRGLRDPCPVLFRCSPPPPRHCFPSCFVERQHEDMVRDMPHSPGLTNHHLPGTRAIRPKGKVIQGLGPSDQQTPQVLPHLPGLLTHCPAPGLNSELPAWALTPAPPSELSCLPPLPALGLQTWTWGLGHFPLPHLTGATNTTRMEQDESAFEGERRWEGQAQPASPPPLCSGKQDS